MMKNRTQVVRDTIQLLIQVLQYKCDYLNLDGELHEITKCR